MSNILTTLLCTPLICMQILFAGMSSPSFDDYTNSDTGYQAVMIDEVNILTSIYEWKLSTTLQAFTDYGNIAIISVDNHEDSSEEYANEAYATLFGDADGMVILFDECNKDVCIRTFGRLATMISMYDIVTLQYNAFELVSQNDYFYATKNALQNAMNVIQNYSETTFAYSNPITGYRVVMSDKALLLSDEEKANLIKVMEPITAYGNVAFVSVHYTLPNTDDTARNYYYGLFGTDSGTLFLIDMNNRYIWIHSDGQVYKTITTSYANTITDNAYSLATDEKYYECAEKVFGQILTLLNGGKISQPMKYICNIILGLIIAVSIHFSWMAWCAYIRRPKNKELLADIHHSFTYSNPHFKYTHCKREKKSSSSSGGRRAGGGGFRSGGGGGFRSGGGGGHRF